MLLSHLEKQFLKSVQKPTKCVVCWSLWFFKYSRLTILILASLEVSFIQRFTLTGLWIGLTCVIVGIGLRIAAICSLGSLWSYHASITNNHYIVRSGIYRWLRHPSYIGNIHLLGLMLVIGAPFSSVVAGTFIVAFYMIRAKAEDRLLAGLSEKVYA